MRQSRDHHVTVWRHMMSKGLKEEIVNIYEIASTCVKCYIVLLIISAQALWPNFEANLNPKLEKWHQPKLVCINYSYLLAWIYWVDFIQFYILTPMDYSPWFKRKIWPNLKTLKLERPHQLKVGVHSYFVNIYLHEFFEPIPFDSMFWPPWIIVHGLKGILAIFEN